MVSRDTEHRATHDALFSDYCPPLIAQARARQDEILLSTYRGHAKWIADLGCGDGCHASLMAPTYERYDAFELAPKMAAMARERIKRERLQNVTVNETDLSTLEKAPATYDLVLCMYFTPGNFRDVCADLSIYTDHYLDHNPVFSRIMRIFFDALTGNGRMLLTVYRDTPEAEAAQHDFYNKTGQHPVTPLGSRFVATREGFWSARWTRNSMLSNLADAGIDSSQVEFHELNEIAWLVEIKARPAIA